MGQRGAALGGWDRAGNLDECDSIVTALSVAQSQPAALHIGMRLQLGNYLIAASRRISTPLMADYQWRISCMASVTVLGSISTTTLYFGRFETREMLSITTRSFLFRSHE